MNETIFKNPSEKTKHLEAIVASFYEAIQACNNCNSCHEDCSLNWNYSVCSHGCFLIDTENYSIVIDNLLLCMDYHGLEFKEGIDLTLTKDNDSLERILIKVDSSSIEIECFACPTIINFSDSNNEYYFRLRNGYWRAVNMTTDEIIATGSSDCFDGICSWDEAKELMSEENLIIEEED